MTITNGYCTLAEVRTALNFQSSDTTKDAAIEAIVQDVSREIDNFCRRRFWKSASDETRYYTGHEDEYTELRVDDLVSVTTLKTDDGGDGTFENTWTANTDFVLSPSNASLDGWPYTTIEVNRSTGSYYFNDDVQKGVQVVGIFGWPSIPGPVRRACIIQTVRLYKRNDAPFGVMGSADMGQSIVIPKLDPDVEMLLLPYRRYA